MDNYTLVIDISSDEENKRYSTPIKTLPVNLLGRLNLSDSPVEVWRGSEADFESTGESASTFESDQEEAFIVEKQGGTDSDDYFEEPDSSREMPELTRAPMLRDITNERKREYIPPSKTEKLNDLREPSIEEIEEAHGIKLNDEYYCTAGRGNSFTSAKNQRARKHSVRVIREIPYCTRVPAFKARGALSRHASSRCNNCNEGVHKLSPGLGHGAFKK